MFLSGETEHTEQNVAKKRGRKKKIADNYFDVREEIGVKLFLSAETISDKNEIYNEYLRAPLDKMIESIIRRYKLYRKDMDFREIHNDTHSFLITKVDKFKPDRNKKAYSYFGTICKNYLMGQIIKDQKETNRKISYEDISTSLENRPDMIYYIENEKIELVLDSAHAALLTDAAKERLKQALLEYGNNFHTSNTWDIDQDRVMKNFYTQMVSRYEQMGGTFPVTSFWDYWATPTNGGVMAQPLDANAPTRPYYCVEAEVQGQPELIWHVTESGKIESGSC
jgi:hypothetical protein